MGRGTGKGKGGRGGGRGGGRRMLIDNIEEMQMRDTAFAESRKARAARRGESDSEGEGESGSEEGEVPAVGGDDAERAAAIEKMAAAKAAAAKAAPAEDDETVFRMSSMGISKNPNAKKGRSEFSVKGLDDAEVVDQESIMSRREREALEAARKKEEYMKRHLAGETDAAKADLARLAEVRRRRAEMEKQRLAEGRGIGMTAHGIESSEDSDSDSDEDAGGKPKAAKAAKAAPAAAAPAMSERESKKRAAALGVEATETVAAAAAADGPPKLKSIDIKKMNGDALKEACKERDLKIQGQKKELMQRLLDYEAARA